MGLTLIAILMTALLLPGIVAVRIFYRAGQTNEVEPTVPTLSSTQGIALVGLFSVIVHALYSALSVAIPEWFQSLSIGSIDLPPPDPYALLLLQDPGQATPERVSGLFFGLVCLCLLAMLVGWLSGLLVVAQGDPAIFHGPLGGMLSVKRDDDSFVTAYVLSKVEKDGRAIGYQGTVASLLRDEDRFPSKVLLRQVSVFYLNFPTNGPSGARWVKRSIGSRCLRMTGTISLSASSRSWTMSIPKLLEKLASRRGPCPARFVYLLCSLRLRPARVSC